MTAVTEHPPSAPIAPGSRPAVAATKPRRSTAWLWSTPPVLLLAAAFLYPLYLVVKQAVEGSPPDPSNPFKVTTSFSDTLKDPGTRTVIKNTIEMAVYSTAGCLVLGFLLALIIAFVPFPGAKAVSRLIDVFLSFPSFLITVSIMFLYGRVGMVNHIAASLTAGRHDTPVNFVEYSPWGIWLAELIYFTPFVMRPLLTAFSQIDSGQLEAAASLGARAGRVVVQVILPEALPALFAGGSLVLMLTMNEYGIVSFTGAKYQTLPVLIENFAKEQTDYAGACALAVINIVLSLALFAGYRVLLARMSGGRRAAVYA
jgi:2-aminoethylphosphonate transport system permease protein